MSLFLFVWHLIRCFGITFVDFKGATHMTSAIKDNRSTPSRQGRGSETQTDIPALEAEIDRLVYALCALTDEGISVVEAKK